MQDAYVAALERWPATGVPDNALGWLVGVARHKAIDRLRREAARSTKEAAAMRELGDGGTGQDASPPDAAPRDADMLSLVFMCCHPALGPGARVALTLRSVCGLSTAEIAAAFLVSEETMAKRLVRARTKIREAGIPFRVPGPAELPERLDAVLRVIYVLFTEGHMATRGEALVRGDLCDTAIWMARGVSGLLPGESEAMGLLALLLLTDARRAARTDDLGGLVAAGGPGPQPVGPGDDRGRRGDPGGGAAPGPAGSVSAARGHRGLPFDRGQTPTRPTGGRSRCCMAS